MIGRIKRAGFAATIAVLCGCSDPVREHGTPVGDQTPVLLADVVAGKPAAADSILCVEGTLQEICPTAGCWAYLGDGKDSLRLEFIDFTLTRDYKSRRCRVLGKLKNDADPPVLLVRGMRLVE